MELKFHYLKKEFRYNDNFKLLEKTLNKKKLKILCI